MQKTSSISNFKKRTLYGAIGVLGLLLIANILANYAMHTLDSNSWVVRSLHAHKDYIYQGHDVLFLGDSRTHQGADAGRFIKEYNALSGAGISAYTLGRPAMQTNMMYYVLKDYLANTAKKPKIVAVNLSFYLLNGNHSKVFWVRHYSPSWWQVLDAAKTGYLSYSNALKWYVDARIPLRRHRKHFLQVGKDLALNKNKFFDDYEDLKALRARAYDPKYLGYLPRLGENITAEGIQLLIYEFPWPEQLDSPAHREVVSYYQTLIRSMATSNPYIHIVSYDHYWDVGLFADQQHLNDKGAAKLAPLLAQWIKPILQTSPTK